MRRRTVAIAVGAVAAAGLAAGGAVYLASGEEPAASAEDPGATAAVEQQDLAKSEEVVGTLSYGAVRTLNGTAPGVVTWLPEAGTVIGAGDAVYDVDNVPVVAMLGDLPLWRDLAPGVEGPDVAQLESNLADLGYGGFTEDDAYTDATAEAVEEWQDDNGMEETGAVAVGAVLFSPDEVRVAEQVAAVGDPASGPILGYTANERRVSVQLEIADQDLVAVDQAVTVTLPDGGEAAGVVAEVGQAVSGSTDPEEDEPETVEVTVRIEDQSLLGELVSAPVTVELVAETREDVLTVPVEALLALREGGYGVEVVDGAATTLVPVETGVFADGRVEVESPELAAGMTVAVPS
ncbi:peptidoglycan-binding protein [Glycomyces harbinensis]|uniref:Putative peptidoglycan binding domain-containing protein n=1 Tax=Glycomyces harbinensis TaxID=58114 RepID=A0A1G7BEB8_9ACTN|nr:peptidoglycan-binding protein [Glycomyces harbinensis]SDE25383.1 Putative peptidoglycan binding domain-containing protein [Glycomyces harbinensis]